MYLACNACADPYNVGMGDHGYGLRSKDCRPPPPPELSTEANAACLLLSEDEQDFLIHTTWDHRGGLLSSRPPPKKFKAASGSAIIAACGLDPSFLSDLTDLEDSESPPPADSGSLPKKRRRSVRHCLLQPVAQGSAQSSPSSFREWAMQEHSRRTGAPCS